MTHVFVGQRADELRLAARKIRLALEQPDSDVDLVLLQTELRERRDGGLALGVNAERLLATLFGCADVVLPLEQRKTFVHERKDIHRWRLGVLDLDCLFEFLDGVLEAALVEQELPAGDASVCAQPLTSGITY